MTRWDRKTRFLFDCEFVCISHAFCDFFRFGSHEYEAVCDDLVNEYLQLWGGYADLGKLREAFQIGSLLGLALKLWSLWERAALCDYQKTVALQTWMRETTLDLQQRAEKQKGHDNDYAKSAEVEMEEQFQKFAWHRSLHYTVP